MAYTTKQEQEIVIARKRIAEKKGTPTDIANVKHFDSKRSLTGTLSGTRSLPDDDSQLTNMQSVMRMFKTESDKAQPSPLSKLQNFESITGIKPITTGAITGVIEMGEKERYADIAERSRTLVDLIGEQEERKEKQRQDNLKWAETLFSSVENPFTVFSSDDIENMKLGIITPEMTTKVKNAPSKKIPSTRTITPLKKVDVKLSQSDKNQSKALGADIFPVEVQNTLLRLFNENEQIEFMKLYKTKSKKQSIEPSMLLENFARELDTRESGGKITPKITDNPFR